MAEQNSNSNLSLTERLDKLQFKRGFDDAVAGHRPSVFGGAYLAGYKSGLGEREEEDKNFAVNEVRFDYDLPPIE